MVDKTALDILQEIPSNDKTTSIEEILQQIPPDDDKTTLEIPSDKIKTSRIKIAILPSWKSWKAPSESLDKFREIGMVIVVLIAAMAFRAVVSPPGGVWQEDSSTHKAGAAVMAYTHPNIYKHFARANTVAFASSLIIIFLLTTRLSSIHVLVMVAVVHTMWVSLASIAVSYGASVMVITPNTQTQSLGYVIVPVVAVTVSIIGLFWLRKCTGKRNPGEIFSSMIRSHPPRPMRPRLH